MAKLGLFLVKYRIPILIVSLVIVVILFIYFTGKKAGDRPERLDYPEGASVPKGWSPAPDVARLHTAMAGLGTDEDAIWKSLDGKTDGQLISIYNQFGVEYGNLLEWFEDDLSGTDLDRAVNYYSGLV